MRMFSSAISYVGSGQCPEDEHRTQEIHQMSDEMAVQKCNTLWASQRRK